MIDILETDLFKPIQKFYQKLGYVVEGEVKDCDIVVKNDKDYMAIELKTNFNFKLLIQAVNRQKLFDLVYVAIPIHKVNPRSKSYKDKLHLLKRLGIGLLLVNVTTEEVECVQQPIESERNRIMGANKKKKESIIKEFEQRILKNNVGGTNHQPITTHYREQCYYIAYLLKDKPQSASDLANFGLKRDKVYRILQGNFYGWFEKEKRGIYRLSTLGKEVLERDQKLIKKIVKTLIKD